MTPRPRKQVPLRIPPELYDAYARWAADELRSVNAQIEAVLTSAARKAGRLRASQEGGPTDGGPGNGEGSPGVDGTE